MATTTITIDSAARAALFGALLAMLGEEADRLAGALSARDRDQSPEPVRAAYDGLRRVGELLASLGWRAGAAGRTRIDAERQLPLALEALRRELECAQELVADAQAHGDAKEVTLAMERVRETDEALRRLERPRPAADT